MNVQSMARLVKRFVSEYGVTCTWKRQQMVDNGRGVMIPSDEPPQPIAEKVLLLAQAFNPRNYVEGPAGLTVEFVRYIMTLSGVDIQKDDIITDNTGFCWKTGVPDRIDVKGVVIAKQAQLFRADGGSNG